MCHDRLVPARASREHLASIDGSGTRRCTREKRASRRWEAVRRRDAASATCVVLRAHASGRGAEETGPDSGGALCLKSREQKRARPPVALRNPPAGQALPEPSLRSLRDASTCPLREGSSGRASRGRHEPTLRTSSWQRIRGRQRDHVSCSDGESGTLRRTRRWGRSAGSTLPARGASWRGHVGEWRKGRRRPTTSFSEEMAATGPAPGARPSRRNAAHEEACGVGGPNPVPGALCVRSPRGQLLATVCL